MEFKVIWSDEAIGDLHEVCAYIAQDNPEAALRMGQGMLDHVQILTLSRSLGQRIRGVRRDLCGRSCSAHTASSMMCLRSCAGWTSSTSGMAPAKNLSSERPWRAPAHRGQTE